MESFEQPYTSRDEKDGIKDDAEAEAEAIEETIDRLLIEVIESNARKANEGTKGIILKLEFGDFSEDLIEQLEKRGISIDNDQAVKLLKVYAKGEGEREYNIQRTAYKKLQEVRDLDRYARVPQPQLYRDIDLGEKTKEHIGKVTNYSFMSSSAELFLMDFVEGDDIHAHLIREVARHHPHTRDIADAVDDIPLGQVRERVVQALGFEVPGGKSRDEGERAFEEMKVFNSNMQKLYSFLKRAGVTVKPYIRKQIENSISHLHENGIVHRDLHERNIMVSGDPFERGDESDNAQAYIIDFGESVQVEAGNVSSAYVDDEDDVRYVNDKALPSRLEKYLSGKKEKPNYAL